MPEASNTITIARPVHEVFAFLANAENDRQWRPGVLEIERVSGDGVGSRYRQVVSGPGGRKVNADIEVTAFTPDQHIGFRATSGPVRPIGSYDVAPAGDGTSVAFRLSAQVGGIKKLLMGSMVQKTMDKEVAALTDLKRVLEQRAG